MSLMWNFICIFARKIFNYMPMDIRKNPTFNAHSGLSMKYDLISDSIRTELLGMTDHCTLSDVAYVKLNTSLYNGNKELGSQKENATKFFDSLDKSPAYDIGGLHKLKMEFVKTKKAT